MKLKDLLVLYDGSGTLCINDDELNCLCKGDIWNVTLYIVKLLPSVSMTTNFV